MTDNDAKLLWLSKHDSYSMFKVGSVWRCTVSFGYWEVIKIESPIDRFGPIVTFGMLNGRYDSYRRMSAVHAKAQMVSAAYMPPSTEYSRSYAHD